MSVIRSNKNRLRLSRLCFTLNNYTEDEYNSLTELFKTFKWAIIAKESGEKEDTPHLQGAVVIGKQMAHSTIKKWPGFSRAHFENMKGTPHDSYVYCNKQDPNPFHHGEIPTPGKRTDLESVVSSLRSGSSLADIANSDDATTLARYPRGLTLLSQLYDTTPKVPPHVVWLYGESGLGKTRSATEYADSYWISSGELKWFDGYTGQDTAILDDFRPSQVSFPKLLRLLDRYEISVEIKGGYRRWVPKTIFITANADPTTMFQYKTPENITQLTRRIHKIIHVTEYPIKEPLS